MGAFTLLLTVFLFSANSTVTTSSLTATFPNKDLCEEAKTAYVAAATAQGGWFSGKPSVVAVCTRAS